MQTGLLARSPKETNRLRSVNANETNTAVFVTLNAASYFLSPAVDTAEPCVLLCMIKNASMHWVCCALLIDSLRFAMFTLVDEINFFRSASLCSTTVR